MFGMPRMPVRLQSKRRMLRVFSWRMVHFGDRSLLKAMSWYRSSFFWGDSQTLLIRVQVLRRPCFGISDRARHLRVPLQRFITRSERDYRIVIWLWEGYWDLFARRKHHPSQVKTFSFDRIVNSEDNYLWNFEWKSYHNSSLSQRWLSRTIPKDKILSWCWKFIHNPFSFSPSNPSWQPRPFPLCKLSRLCSH